MEDKTRHCSRITQCPGAEFSRWSVRTDKSPMDFLQEVPDPEEILLDSLICQRPEGEESYQNRGDPVSPDNSELDNVLDVIFNSSASDHPHIWADNATAGIHDMPITSVTTVKTFGDQRTDAEDSKLWLEVKNEITCPLSQKEPNIFGNLEDASGDRSPVNGGGLGSLTCRHPSLLGINLASMPVNTLYLSPQERQVTDADECDLRSSPACSAQQMVPYIKQASSLHLKGDDPVKLEKSEVSLFTTPKETKLSQEYGIPHPSTLSQDPNQYMDFTLCKKESAAVYESFCGTPTIMDENPTTNPPQNHYQPMNLNGNQQQAYQSQETKETYLPQILLPYVQYIRSEDPGEASQYIFDSLPQKTCLICGDEASGCHYGVLTCGSCKVFFKRAVEGQHNYLCAGRNDCIVDKIRRKNCPSCRLRKCCQAGMVLGGRKFKKFNKIKSGREIGTFVIQQSSSAECPQALTQRTSTGSTQEIQFIPELLQILQSIEPEVVYAGYDNTQPETPSALLCSLNQLCERQLLNVVKWSKSLPGFRNLHIDDQIILLQYSWMSLMAFAMGWRSYKHVSGQMLYFAPDLVLNEQRMKDSSFYSLCLSMQQLPQEFVKLQISHEEFLCMKAVLLLNTIPLEGLKSQSLFEEMRSNYIRELAKAVGIRHKGVVASSQRFFHLTKVMDSMHELVKQLHLYCLNTFLQSRTLSVEFPEMMTEVISAQLPKILAGMVKQLVFHQK